MAAPVVNPSPKTRFMQSPQVVSAHRDMIATNTFQIGCDFAMLEYQTRLALITPADFNTYAASGMKMQGALEFLQILRMLGETPKLPVVTTPGDNLSHRS